MSECGPSGQLIEIDHTNLSSLALVQESMANDSHGLSNKFVVSTNRLLDKALQLTARRKVILLCPRRVKIVAVKMEPVFIT